MIIVKELNEISKLIENGTRTFVHNISVDIEDEQLTLWCTLYDKYVDNSYVVSVTVEEKTLTQFSNDRNIKEIVQQLILEWTDVAKDCSTLH
jgi:peroxiredoxin